jgi:Zn-dependent protease with chaperone function
MSHFIDCPGCRKQFRVGPEAAGKRVKCRACGAAVSVPAADEEEADSPRPARRKDGPRPAGNPFRVSLLLLLTGYFPFLTLLCLAVGGLAAWLIVWGLGQPRIAGRWANPLGPVAIAVGALAALPVLHVLWGLRALFWRRNDKDEWEVELPDQWQEGLAELVDQIATDRDLNPPDVLRLHAVEVAHVYQDRRGRDVLVIGGVTVAACTRRALAGIIAHELGHLTAGDTALSKVAARWHQVMGQLERQFWRRSWAKWNPLVWMIRGYHAVYALVWFANQRRQEYAADGHQVRTVGKEKAAAALVLVTLLQDMEWAELGSVAEACVEMNQPMEQIFAEQVRRVRVANPADWEETLRKALKPRTGWYDSHPCLSERLKALGMSPKKSLRAALDLMDPSGEPATSLFANWPVVEKFLTERILEIVRDNYLARQECEAIIEALNRRAVERARQGE